MPRIVDWDMNGKIEIDPMIIHGLTLENINMSLGPMRAGESICSVVLF